MRLVRVGVKGYKRFAASTEMSVDGRVIGIVGPNEAGKTSFLEGLTHLSRSGEFSRGEWTRGQDPPTGRVVWARYLIDDDDRTELGEIPGVADLRWYEVWKGADGGLYHSVEPSGAVTRELEPRKRRVADLRRTAAHRLLRESEGEHGVRVADQLAAVADRLDNETQMLKAEVLDDVRAAANALDGLALNKCPKYIGDLPDRLREVAAHEEADHPGEVALGVLDERHPRFVIFSDEHRGLRSDYELTEVADAPPAALANLAELAGLNLQSLRDAIVMDDYGRAEYIIEQANAQLKEAFAEAWRQSGVYPRLRTDETVLRVFIRERSGEGYTDVAERSDGLRAFIALFTFAALRGSRQAPVLLIDEAETHLHYDAQADLVRVFSRQQTVPKIIYTTHSAGCLPQDLAGVRLVAAIDESASEVRNAFWSEGPGLTPLLIGMGASLLAFSTSRRAVFVEGGADVVLLPTLLREAVGRQELDFQVAPGLAEVHPSKIPGLDLEAAAVAYLVDGDAGGTGIRKKLVKSGVDDSRIVTLGGKGSGIVLEDAVQKRIYMHAVNRELARSHGEAHKITEAEIGNTNRTDDVKRWCKTQGIEDPNRTAVAYQVIDIHAEGNNVVAPARRATLKSAYTKLASLLQVKEGEG